MNDEQQKFLRSEIRRLQRRVASLEKANQQIHDIAAAGLKARDEEIERLREIIRRNTDAVRVDGHRG